MTKIQIGLLILLAVNFILLLYNGIIGDIGSALINGTAVIVLHQSLCDM